MISNTPSPASTPAPGARPTFTTLQNGALLIDLRAPGVLNDPAAVRAAITENLEVIRNAERLIVDTRGAGRQAYIGERRFEAFNELLVPTPITLAAGRSVRHSGYRAQASGTTFYGSEVVTQPAALVKPRAGMGPRRVAFVVDRDALVPSIALALRAAGLGAIVAVGEPPLAERSVNITTATTTADISMKRSSSGGGGGGGTGITCAASTIPANASCIGNGTPPVTAVCSDGAYSCSQNRSGTCSTHGGVKLVAPLGK